MNDLSKGILSFVLLVSLILFEYSPVKTAWQLTSASSEYGIPIDTTDLDLQIFAIALLHFVVFGIIWSVPDSESRKRSPRTKAPEPEEDLTEEQKDALHDGTYIKEKKD